MFFEKRQKAYVINTFFRNHPRSLNYRTSLE